MRAVDAESPHTRIGLASIRGPALSGRERRYDVLVIGAGEGAGVAAVRSLGRRGLKVLAGGHDAASAGFFSRYAAGRLHYPRPSADSDAFLACVLDAVRCGRIRLVLPLSEPALLALDAARTEIEAFTRLAAAPSRAIHLALDKWEMVQRAEKEGVPVPRTLLPGSTAEALHAARAWGYPVIVKPRGPARTQTMGRTILVAPGFKVAHALTPQDLRSLLTPFEEVGTFPLLQTYAPGRTVGAHGFMHAGRLLTFSQFRIGRQLGDAWIWVDKTSEPPDPVIRRHVERLLQSIDYDGVANVQFLRDDLSGRLAFLEVNPRVALGLAAHIHSGEDLPWMLWQYYVEGRLPSSSAYRTGVRTVWVSGQVRALPGFLAQWRARRWRTEVPTRFGAIVALIRDALDPRVRDAILSWHDPIPGLVDLASALGESARACVRRLSGRRPSRPARVL